MNTDIVKTRGPIHASAASPTMVRRTPPKQAKFRVEGISDASDASRLEHRLARQVGVIGVCVNTITDLAYVAYDPALTSVSMLCRQIELSGLRATPR